MMAEISAAEVNAVQDEKTEAQLFLEKYDKLAAPIKEEIFQLLIKRRKEEDGNKVLNDRADIYREKMQSEAQTIGDTTLIKMVETLSVAKCSVQICGTHKRVEDDVILRIGDTSFTMSCIFDGVFYNDYHCTDDFELEGDYSKEGEQMRFDVSVSFYRSYAQGGNYSLRPVFDSDSHAKKKKHLNTDIIRTFLTDCGLSSTSEHKSFEKLLVKMFSSTECYWDAEEQGEWENKVGR